MQYICIYRTYLCVIAFFIWYTLYILLDGYYMFYHLFLIIYYTPLYCMLFYVIILYTYHIICIVFHIISYFLLFCLYVYLHIFLDTYGYIWIHMYTNIYYIAVSTEDTHPVHDPPNPAGQCLSQAPNTSRSTRCRWQRSVDIWGWCEIGKWNCVRCGRTALTDYKCYLCEINSALLKKSNIL